MGLEADPEVESVVLNGAVPKLETAKVVTRGLGLVMGDALVTPGKSMDEEIWGMGGCAPMLRLVELAKTTVQLSNAVSICIDALRDSWRNSEGTCPRPFFRSCPSLTSCLIFHSSQIWSAVVSRLTAYTRA